MKGQIYKAEAYPRGSIDIYNYTAKQSQPHGKPKLTVHKFCRIQFIKESGVAIATLT